MYNTYLYYYNLLPSHLKAVYTKILEALRSHSDRVAIPFISTDELEKVMEYIVLDCNVIPLFDEYKYLSFRESVCAVEFKYLLNKGYQHFINKELISKASKIADYARSCGNDTLCRLKALHKYFTKNVKYSAEHPCAFSAAGPLLFGEGVCIGMASALHLLLCILGIPVICVRGKHEGEEHAWNLVYCDGNWHPFDITASVCFSKGGCPSFEGFGSLPCPEQYTLPSDVSLPEFSEGRL